MKQLHPCSFQNGFTSDVYVGKTDGQQIWASVETRDRVALRLERFACRGSLEELDVEALSLSREIDSARVDADGLVVIAGAVILKRGKAA